MILQSLAALAQQEQLLEDPAYQNVGVSFAIALDLDKEGRFLQLLDLRESSGKRKQAPKVLLVPKRAGRTVNGQEDFLVDKSEYVLGAEPDGKRSPEKLFLRLQLFRSAIQRAWEATKQAELQAVLNFIDSEEDRQRCLKQAKEASYKSNDLFCFDVGDQYVHELSAVKLYWSSQYAPSAAMDLQQCAVCGGSAVPIEKHPQVKLAGGSTSGIAHVSFNASAFESYGWSRNENAPICQACADGYATALRRCLDSNYPDPKNPGATLNRQSIVLSENLTAVYWTDQPNSELLAGVGKVNWFDSDEADLIQGQFLSPWKGSQSGSVDGRFYCLFLQGGQGRATLRGWHTQDIRNVQDHLRDWFEQTASVDNQPRPLRFLLNSLAVKREGNRLPEHFIRSLFLAALFGYPVALPVLFAAVERNKAEKTVSPERAALLQAYFARKKERKKYMGLDLTSASTAYKLGRLLAVLQKQQRRLNPNLNKNITDRFFTSLSTRPASVFPALIALARTHTSGLKRKGSFYEARIAELLDGIYPIPTTFQLEEQGQFALGHYHQRHADIEAAKAHKEQSTGNQPEIQEGTDNNE